MHCPWCQNDVPGDADFCPECGRELTGVCGKCGTPNAAAHKFCKKCGQALTVAAATNRKAAKLAIALGDNSVTPRRERSLNA